MSNALPVHAVLWMASTWIEPRLQWGRLGQISAGAYRDRERAAYRQRCLLLPDPNRQLPRNAQNGDSEVTLTFMLFFTNEANSSRLIFDWIHC